MKLKEFILTHSIFLVVFIIGALILKGIIFSGLYFDHRARCSLFDCSGFITHPHWIGMALVAISICSFLLYSFITAFRLHFGPNKSVDKIDQRKFILIELFFLITPLFWFFLKQIGILDILFPPKHSPPCGPTDFCIQISISDIVGRWLTIVGIVLFLIIPFFISLQILLKKQKKLLLLKKYIPN